MASPSTVSAVREERRIHRWQQRVNLQAQFGGKHVQVRPPVGFQNFSNPPCSGRVCGNITISFREPPQRTVLFRQRTLGVFLLVTPCKSGPQVP